ncbi:unnamed protein product [Caretta caretta]
MEEPVPIWPYEEKQQVTINTERSWAEHQETQLSQNKWFLQFLRTTPSESMGLPCAYKKRCVQCCCVRPRILARQGAAVWASHLTSQCISFPHLLTQVENMKSLHARKALIGTCFP